MSRQKLKFTAFVEIIYELFTVGLINKREKGYKLEIILTKRSSRYIMII